MPCCKSQHYNITQPIRPLSAVSHPKVQSVMPSGFGRMSVFHDRGRQGCLGIEPGDEGDHNGTANEPLSLRQTLVDMSRWGNGEPCQIHSHVPKAGAVALVTPHFGSPPTPKRWVLTEGRSSATGLHQLVQIQLHLLAIFKTQSRKGHGEPYTLEASGYQLDSQATWSSNSNQLGCSKSGKLAASKATIACQFQSILIVQPPLEETPLARENTLPLMKLDETGSWKHNALGERAAHEFCSLSEVTRRGLGGKESGAPSSLFNTCLSAEQPLTDQTGPMDGFFRVLEAVDEAEGRQYDMIVVVTMVLSDWIEAHLMFWDSFCGAARAIDLGQVLAWAVKRIIVLMGWRLVRGT
ncbi:uncharacterized protein BP01DRAFT_420083 [Aspergillus saccharolyticus JOP 1030-1]|uniref:Uncharacterized protein n=1 Tax=Aspergillus saccharolyticus JOP 1030-1 TaxID=1450539 RepID=A0A318ZQU0_9EURO|nr:hypothetical protein BP01DRAFT_420083 [Aspergillus saccharolyticus JOP 1030-1]PYH49989.1 hypothetical protein BP01DRAFT_420083 [Aspergillus saccharolyticus JOP 1030-1]